MADPVSILGTVVGVASLAIQVSDILRSYWKGVSNFQDQVRQILNDTQLLSEVLRKLQDFLERDSTKLSKSFTTISTLYSANISCEIQLSSLMETLRKELEGSKRRKLLKAIRWPLKVEETQKVSVGLRGYVQTFQFALSLDGCQLLLQSSEEVTAQLERFSLSTSTSAQQSKDVASVLQVISALPQTANAIRKGVEQLEDNARAQEGEKALNWLASDHASVRHQTIRKSRLAKTGEWFFNMNCYKQWQNEKAPILWVQGRPGVGKSVLLSSVADRLASEASMDEGVAFFYCEYSQASEAQAATSIVASIIHQLALQLNTVPQELLEAYQNHRRQSTRPDLQQSVSLLRQIIKRFSKVWLLVDAVDELDPCDRQDLMDIVEVFMPSARFFMTSRPQSFDSDTLEESTLRFTLSAQAEDLVAFIRSKMGKAATASRRVRESPGWDTFVEETVEKLVEVADGMFILVSLQLEMLLRPRTLAEMRKLLQDISVKLDDFYANTLERIRERESEMALQVLCWLVKQMRPLSVNEIQEALAVEHSTTQINSDAFIHKDDILDMSCGFVIVNEDDVLSLSHATVHEFLMSNLIDVCHFDITMTKTCLRYLNFKTFREQTMNFKHSSNDEYDKEYDYRIRHNPFFPYAARHWDDHFNRCPTSEEINNLALDLITGPNVTSMLQVYGANAVVKYPPFSPLHVAALLGIPSLVELLIARATEGIKEAQQRGPNSLTLDALIDSNGAFGNTPLLFAVKGRHRDITKALLDTNAVNPSIMDNTIIRWTLEWGQYDLLRQMIKLPQFNEHLARQQFGPQIERYLSNETGRDEDADDVNKSVYDRTKDDLDERLRQRSNQRRHGGGGSYILKVG